MTTLIEDMRLFLQQMCGAFGMSGTAMNVVPLVVLGVALNVAALTLVESAGTERRPTCQKTTLQDAAQTELKVMRTVVASTLKTIGKGQRGWCGARSWVSNLQHEVANSIMGAVGLRVAPMASECARSTKEFQKSKSCRLRIVRRAA
jgi:hypothetical protein